MGFTMTVGRKLLMASAVSAVLTVAVGAVGYWGIGSISSGTDKMLKEEAKIAEHSARVRANVLGLPQRERRFARRNREPTDGRCAHFAFACICITRRDGSFPH